MAGKNLTAKQWLEYLMTFKPKDMEECVKTMFDIVTDWKNANEKPIDINIVFTGADKLEQKFADERAAIARANNRLPTDWRIIE